MDNIRKTAKAILSELLVFPMIIVHIILLSPFLNKTPAGIMALEMAAQNA